MLSKCVCHSHGADLVGAKKRRRMRSSQKAAIWGIFGVLALSPRTAEERRCGCGSFCLQAGGAPRSGQGRWDGQDGRADKHGSAEVRGGVRVAECRRQWGVRSVAKRVSWAISACPAKNRKIV